MERLICLMATIVVALLLCGQAMAGTTNSCDDVAVSFSKHAFANQASQTSLTKAVTKAKTNGATPQEIICASLSIERFTTTDIVNALQNAGFDPVLIRMAAKDTGLNMAEVNAALAPGQATPAPLTTTLGFDSGTITSPSAP